jgi:SAM-dependent methyltransferase
MYVMLATMVRDDGDYLDEWVNYNLSVGFEHILIYDHKSIIPVEPKWGKKVTVKRIESELPFQEYIHLSTFRDYKPYWMMTCDVDEFLVLLQHQDIKDLLVNYEEFGGLGIPWSMYGSSGHITKPDGEVKDNYLWRTVDTTEKQYVKTIANTKYFKNMGDPHFVYSSRPLVNEAFEPFTGSLSESPRQLCKLNHYFTRSYEEWIFKRNRGTGYQGVPLRPMEWFWGVHQGSRIYDPVLSKVKWSLKQLWDYGRYRIYPTDKEFNHHYLDFYDRLFLPYNDKLVNIFEVGYAEGGSCKLWEDYFLSGQIRSIDINDRHLPEGATELISFNSDRVRFNIININDLFVTSYFDDFPVDIAIDDGSHNIPDQIAFLKQMYPIVRAGGLLIIEDVADITGLCAEIDKTGYPYEIIDFRPEFNRWDNVIILFRK